MKVFAFMRLISGPTRAENTYTIRLATAREIKIYTTVTKLVRYEVKNDKAKHIMRGDNFIICSTLPLLALKKT